MTKPDWFKIQRAVLYILHINHKNVYVLSNWTELGMLSYFLAGNMFSFFCLNPLQYVKAVCMILMI